MMLGFMLLAVSAFLVGPSKILGMPSESSPLMIIGLGILGTGAAFTVIPVIPEMLDATKDDFEDQQTELSDNFSAIFNIAGGLGQIVGPSSAGLLNDSVGFNMTFDIIGLLLIAFNVSYILICGGFGSLGRSFKATAMRFGRKEAPISSDSPRRQLLVNDEDLNDSTSSDPEAEESTNLKGKEIDADEESNPNVSTDISMESNQAQEPLFNIN
jgi:MFS family permease